MGSAEEPGRSFVFSFGLEKLGLVALRAPYVVAVLVVIATVLGAMGVAKLQVDDSLSELFRTNSEELPLRCRKVAAIMYESSPGKSLFASRCPLEPMVGTPNNRDLSQSHQAMEPPLYSCRFAHS